MPTTDIDRDAAWFEALYREHRLTVLRYAQRRVDEPDDLVAEVFSAAWRFRERVPDQPVPWLIRTARNHSLHAVRSRDRGTRLFAKASATAQPERDHADEVADRHDASVLIRLALARLSSADQEILRLTAWEQLDNPTLAYVLQCSEVAARVRLHRAKHRLEIALLRLDPDESTARLTSIEVPS